MNYIYLFFLFISCSIEPSAKVDSLVRAPIYTSSDAGATWQALHLGLPDHTEVSFMESFGSEIIIATDNVGLYISQNNLQSVKAIQKGLPNHKIDAIHVYKNSIYASAYRAGIFRSSNKGESWHALNYNLPNLKVNSILHTKDQLLVGTDIGIYKLDALKKSWTLTSPTAQYVSINKFGDKLVAGSTSGVFLSTDGGNSWKNIHHKGALHYTEILNKKIVAMYVSGDLFTSEDWGNSWQEMNYHPRYGSYVYDAEIHHNFLVISNNYGIHRSADQGQSWNLVYPREDAGFFEFLLKDGLLYGGTRKWDEYRGR